jgi:Family of unknown function (DUF5941)/CDP-alcohol phosphatidyltransferase
VSRSALLYATTPAAGGGPAALVGPRERPALRRLLEQLAALDVRRARVVVRPGWTEAVRAAADGAPLEVTVLGSRDRCEDLRITAQVAAEADADLLLGPAEAMTQREALAGLVADPRIPSGGLTTSSVEAGRRALPIRAAGARIVGATSAYHRVARPNGYFLGFLKVGARDRGEAAAVARRLAELLADPPAGWAEAPARRAAEWRRAFTAAAAEDRAGRSPGVLGWVGDADLEEELAGRARIVEEDVVGLVLVGLLREGLPVAGSNLRLFGFARPLTDDEAETALAGLEATDEDRLALASAVKASDGFFTTFFVSPYSRYIARWAARRGLTPNQVTLVSFLLGVVAAAVFAAGTRAALVAGAVLLQVSFTVDCVDGQLARYTRTFSQLGAWLDSVFDRSKEYLIFAGLAYGSARARGDDVWTLAAAALTLQTVRHMVGFAYSVQPGVTAPMRPPPLEELDDATVGDGAATPPPPPPRPPGAAAPGPDAPARPRARGSAVGALGRRVVAVANALDKHAWARWLRRIVVLPIGERFALISLMAALATPRATFVALLAWGAFAAVYTSLGRILRSLAR